MICIDLQINFKAFNRRRVMIAQMILIDYVKKLTSVSKKLSQNAVVIHYCRLCQFFLKQSLEYKKSETNLYLDDFDF